VSADLDLDEYDPGPWHVPDSDEDRATYQVAGAGHAAWAARRLAQVTRKRGEIQAIAEQEIARIEAWATRRDAPLARDAAFFESTLVAYALAVRAADGRRKSVTLPHATVQTRTVGGAWEAAPEALAWAAESRPDLVEVTRRFSLSAARRALAVTPDGVVDPTTGDLVPGLTVTPKHVTASVTVDTEGANP
jgi:hypothetical protein